MSGPLHDDPALRAETDQVLAQSMEILPQHVEETRELLGQMDKAAVFEQRVIGAVLEATHTQVAMMYAAALLELADKQ